MTTQFADEAVTHKRLECLICNHRIDLSNPSIFSTFSCNVRAYQAEAFKVWQCPKCQTIHCLDNVDLNHYYQEYPVAQATLSPLLWLYCRNLKQKLLNCGLSKNHSVLDYGCGHGLLVEYLRQQGYKSFGYDLYAPKETYGNPDILRQAPFDYIVLQDVIEHVEDPHALLSELNSLLAPGGYILIGTPNAANIHLEQPNADGYETEIHAPYHLHIYSHQSLAFLGRCQGWNEVAFFDHPHIETPWFGLNTRAWYAYQRLFDRSVDIFYEPIKLQQMLRALRSREFLFQAFFGYWLSFRTYMVVMFQKTAD